MEGIGNYSLNPNQNRDGTLIAFERQAMNLHDYDAHMMVTKPSGRMCVVIEGPEEDVMPLWAAIQERRIQQSSAEGVKDSSG
jgi:hypothetical protein